MDGEYAMPYRNPPRTEVPPEFRGPDFLTADLPPSARPGHPRSTTDGLVVGGFTAVCTAIAAFAIGRPTA
ncbi:hypothetical protein HMPREF0724_11919 [Prescottella equi ATCC 33707]|uniref:Uncharacterized protein n=1 Tax=Prescottella equi ATCC 33707 TaxID=525370 RepID=F1TJ46_RHOHA|nr:hypothetical protein HMPREF0724_11919 [Prescottella equi ATCC 33707]